MNQEERKDVYRFRACLLDADIKGLHVDSVSVGKRIKYIRTELLDVTQEFFGKELLVCYDKSTVAKWEKGEGVPNTETLLKIAMLGKITVDALITGVDRVAPLLDEKKLDKLPLDHPYTAIFIPPENRFSASPEQRKLFEAMVESGKAVHAKEAKETKPKKTAKRGKMRGKKA